MSDPKTPFATLGKHLKYVREQSKQSLAEASGAVEIEEHRLARIEAGQERPSEDILLLLISHFDVHEQEAVQLWELANYDSDIPERIKSEASSTSKSLVMFLAMDIRTMYSDGLEIATTDAGLTLNFTQASGPTDITSVGKIGMSHEQAQKMLKQLEQAVLRARYLGNHKLLPPTL